MGKVIKFEEVLPQIRHELFETQSDINRKIHFLQEYNLVATTPKLRNEIEKKRKRVKLLMKVIEIYSVVGYVTLNEDCSIEFDHPELKELMMI